MKPFDYDALVKDVPGLQEGRLFCSSCGRTAHVDPREALAGGWPVCCGATMSLDTPQERARRPAAPSKPSPAGAPPMSATTEDPRTDTAAAAAAPPEPGRQPEPSASRRKLTPPDREPAVATDGSPANPGETWLAVDKLEIHPDNNQHDLTRDEDMAGLVDSIKTHGVLQPVVVRIHPEGKKQKAGVFQLLIGARRLMAARKAGLQHIPARVLNVATEEKAIEVILVENLQRKGVHPLREAEGFALLRDRCHLEYRDIATRVGKSVGYVHGRVKLAGLAPSVKKAWAAETLELSHVLVIAPLQMPDQEKVLEWMTSDSGAHDPANGLVMPLDELRGHVQNQVLLDLSKAPWDLREAKLTSAGPCVGCEFRSASQKELFLGIGDDRCVKPACFATKLKTWGGREIALAEGKAGKKLLRVTDSHLRPKAAPEALTCRGWAKAGKAAPCKSSRRAVKLNDAGSPTGFLDVCADKDCKTHWGSSAKGRRGYVGGGRRGGKEDQNAVWAREQQKREREQARVVAEHKAMLDASLAALVGPDTKAAILDRLVRQLLIEEVRNHLENHALDRMVTLKRAGVAKFPLNETHKLDTRDLCAIALVLRLGHRPWGGDRWKQPFHRFASVFSFDVQRPAAAALKELAALEAAKTAAAKAAGEKKTTKAAPLAAKAKAPGKKRAAGSRA